MALSLLVDFVLKRRALASGDNDPQYTVGCTKRTLLLTIFPAVLDLLQSLICFVGFLFVASSIYQMTRGSVIIFSAILSKVMLKRKLQATHYTSIAIVVCAITLVGIAAVEMEAAASGSSAKKDTSHQAIGILLTVLAQLITALQIVVEEDFLTKRNMRPVLLVGMEGVWGVLFFAVLVPVLQYSPTPPMGSAIGQIYHEDFGDTFTKLGNSAALQGSMVAYIVFVGLYNIFANFVTRCVCVFGCALCSRGVGWWGCVCMHSCARHHRASRSQLSCQLSRLAPATVESCRGCTAALLPLPHTTETPPCN
jgi:hypothetical protein